MAGPGSPLYLDQPSVSSLAGGSTPPKEKAKPPAKKKDHRAKGLTASEIESEIAHDPWSQMGQALAAQLKGDVGTPTSLGPIEAALSGAATAPIAEQAENTALALAGVGAGSPAGQWLQSAIGAGQAAAAPLQAAMEQYGAVYAATASPVEAALQAYGQANTMAVATSPEQAWLSGLTSHITSNLNYYGSIPTASVPSLPPAVVQALQQSGGYGGNMTGLTPLTSLKVNGGQVTQVPSTIGGALGSDYGTVPGTGSLSTTPGA